MSIKKQLIIYRTNITNINKFQSSRIHRLALKEHQSEFPGHKRLNKVATYQGKYVQQKKYLIGRCRKDTEAFLRSIYGKDIKKIAISPFCFERVQNASEEIKYLTKQLCLRQKRINSLTISLKEQNSHDPRFFRILSLLKNLKYLKLELQERNHSLNLETLQKFLEVTNKRQSWPLFKLQILRFSFSSSLSLQSNPDKTLWNFSQSLRNLHQMITLMPTKLEMSIPLEKNCNIETVTYFNETLKSLPQLTRLELRGKSYKFFRNVLGKLGQYQNLQELFLYFSLGYQPETEGNLIQTLQNSMRECKSMKKLEIALLFRNHSTKSPNDSQSQADKILIDLSDSLSSLITLEHLKLEISYQSDNEKNRTGISRVFFFIDSLKNLKSLYLIFPGFVNVTDEELNALCTSLRNLENLSYLKLNLSHSKIKDLGIQSLEQTLPLLKNLDYLALNLDNCEGISNSVMTKFVSSLNQLKYLSSLVLYLRGLEINALFYEALKKTIPQLKFLFFFKLVLSKPQNQKTFLEDLQKWIHLFRARMEGTITASSFDIFL